VSHLPPLRFDLNNVGLRALPSELCPNSCFQVCSWGEAFYVVRPAPRVLCPHGLSSLGVERVIASSVEIQPQPLTFGRLPCTSDPLFSRGFHLFPWHWYEESLPFFA